MKLKLLVLLILTAFISSCTMERKLALQFVELEAPGYPVMVVPPEILYTFNLKAPPPGNYQNTDSALYFSSKYIQYISDSSFLEKYFKGFTERSSESKIDVFFPTDLEHFLQTKRAAFVLRIAQMELTEDTSVVNIEEKINYNDRIKEIPYHQINLSSWFEISMKDSLDGFTYFDEQFITEKIYGDFYQAAWSPDITYEYELIDIEKEDIYEFAEYMGEKHADFLFDLMLNSYIWEKLPEDRKNGFRYLHYNPRYKSIEIADEAFILIEK